MTCLNVLKLCLFLIRRKHSWLFQVLVPVTQAPITESFLLFLFGIQNCTLVFPYLYNCAVGMEALVSLDLGENLGEKPKFQVEEISVVTRTLMPLTFFSPSFLSLGVFIASGDSPWEARFCLKAL